MQAIFFNDFRNAYIPEILKELYTDKVYDSFFSGRSDMVVVDIGANIGLFTYYAYPFVKKIYSVEPSIDHFEILTKMLEFNKMDNVKPIKVAVSIDNGEAEFYHNENATMYSLNKSVNTQPDNVEMVKTMSMDKLLDGVDRIDFLKLDIEGNEHEVIASEGFAKVADRIQSLVVEHHQWSGRNPAQLATTLTDYGFTVRPIKSDATLFGAER